jgi:undecaprenyl-diphosphatase
LEALINLDKTVFFFFNRTLANPITDVMMPFITTEKHWNIPIAAVWLGLMIFGGKKGRITAILAAVTLLYTDQIVNVVVKPLVGRVRPCFTLEHVRLLIRQPHSPSFPSSHAANITAMAALFSVRYPKFTAGFGFIALLISISRMMVGVHYPSDVLAGMLAGFGFSMGILKLFREFEKRRLHPPFLKTCRRSRTEKDIDAG